ncbi:MAG: AMP-binding protein [Lentisphaeria bacterium]|jgi:long-chain acyl-CoA synthetase|nr:AMP-binding protein [Lentisphaeria bacterium]
MRFLERHDKTALIWQDRAYSYDQLLAQVGAFARQLPAAPGDRVVIFAENRSEWAFAFYAVWRLGAIAVPVDALSSADEVAHILRDAEPSVACFSETTRAIFAEALELVEKKPVAFTLEELATAAPVEPEALPEADPDATAVIIYTSGTTGTPKGVMLSFGNLESNLRSVSEDVPIYQSTDRVLVLLPLHHILPLQGTLVMPLSLGGTSVFSPSVASEDIIATLQKHAVTLIIGVPRLYTLIRNGIKGKINQSKVAKLLFALAEKVDSLAFSRLLFGSVQRKFGGHVRYMPCGGAALDEDVIRDFRTLGFEILCGYGMSETAPMISFTRPDAHRPGAAGQIMPANEVRILDGEITVRGANVMQGYFRRPDETAEAVRDGWLHTGDLGHVDADGFIFITGRKKELIVLPSGKNVNPAEIEAKLAAMSPAVAEAGVIMCQDALQLLVLPDFAFLKQEGVLNIEEYLRWHVVDKYNRKASPYKRLRKLSVVREPLPKTRLGKLKRHELDRLVADQSRERAPVAEPDSDAYRAIRDYLAAQAKQPVHPGDHLEIDLALDSLDKVALQTFLESAFGMVFTEQDLIDCPTPAKLAERVDAQGASLTSTVVKWGEILREKVNVTLPRSGLAHVWINRIGRLFLHCCFRLRGQGVENLPEGPCILAPNHQSYLDGLLVTSFLGKDTLKKTYFYAKSEHIRRGWLKFLARTNNVIVTDINRNLKESLQKLAAVLKDGRKVIIFPEGTRSRDGQLGEFKRTFAILGRELNVPIVPVVIRGAYEAMPAGRWLPRMFRPIEVTFLPPVQPGQESYDELAERVQTAVAGKLG